MSDFSQLTLLEAAGLIESGALSPVELATDFLERAQRVNADLNCLITVAEDLLAQARKSEQELSHNKYRGRLHGIPIILKDNLLTTDIRTTAGSAVLDDWRARAPGIDAHVVTRLRRAGALIAAKANLYELAYGFPHPQFGTVDNPLAPGHTTGGSSNGSAAAVAARLCFAALGTDTGGSIRIPAAFCGLVGVKPSFGRVGRSGLVPLSVTLDCVGPLTRTVEDAAAVLDVISGYDRADPATSRRRLQSTAAQLAEPIAGLRIGLVSDPAAGKSLSEAAKALAERGASVSEVKVEWIGEGRHLQSIITAVEAAEVQGRLLRENPGGYSETIRQRLEVGSLIPGVDYLRAQRARLDLIRRSNEFFQQYDALLTPTTVLSPPPIDRWKRMLGNRSRSGEDAELSAQVTQYTSVWNVTGNAATVVPFPDGTRTPAASLQIVTRRYTDEISMRLAYALEQDCAQRVVPRLPDQSAGRECASA